MPFGKDPYFASVRSQVRRQLDSLLAELYQKSGAEKYAMGIEEFAAILLTVAEKYLPADTEEAAIRDFYCSLRVSELALARACAAGNEQAWEDFHVRYRKRLHYLALGITREDSTARELADSIYAGLYGAQIQEGERRSKFSHYSGRNSLEGWLRTVLVQSHLEAYRGTRRNVANAWIVDGEPPLEKGRTYEFAINVGTLCEHAMAAPRLRDFDWKDNPELDVWIVLSGHGFTAEPHQQKFTLPKQGDTDPIFFAINPTGYGSLLLRISLYFARELTLLQEFEVPIPVKIPVKEAVQVT